MKKLLTAAALAVALLLGSTPLVQAEQNCTETLEKNCTSCHYNSRICDKVGKKNRRAWKNTIKRMIRYGMKIEDSAFEQITDCLVSLEEKPGKFCD